MEEEGGEGMVVDGTKRWVGKGGVERGRFLRIVFYVGIFADCLGGVMFEKSEREEKE